MPLLFPEPYIDAAIASLRAALPGAIQAENARHGDFALPVPDAAEGYFWGVETAFQPPAVEVGVAEEQLSGFSLGQVEADSAPVVMVRGWLALDSEINSRERLARSLYRFGRAIGNVLIAPDAFGHGPVLTQVRAFWRLNPDTRESESVTGSATIAFTLEDVEQYG